MQFLYGNHSFNYRKLTKDIIGVLNTLLISKNNLVSIKASELFTIIKDKVISEIFEFEKDSQMLYELFNKKTDFDSKSDVEENMKEIIGKIDLCITDLPKLKKSTGFFSKNSETFSEFNSNIFKRNTRKSSTRMDEDLEKLYTDLNTNNLLNINNKMEKENSVSEKKNSEMKFMKLKTDSDDLKEIINFEVKSEPTKKVSFSDFNQNKNNNNISNNINISSINNSKSSQEEKENHSQKIQKNSNLNNNTKLLKKKRTLIPLNSQQTNLLFKGYLYDDKIIMDDSKLKSGYYIEDFFKNSYSKVNGLPNNTAFKRKNVCLKLRHIFKNIVILFLKNI